MLKRLIGRKPGMGQQTDATRQITLDGHLLHIQEGYPLPS